MRNTSESGGLRRAFATATRDPRGRVRARRRRGHGRRHCSTRDRPDACATLLGLNDGSSRPPRAKSTGSRSPRSTAIRCRSRTATRRCCAGRCPRAARAEQHVVMALEWLRENGCEPQWPELRDQAVEQMAAMVRSDARLDDPERRGLRPSSITCAAAISCRLTFPPRSSPLRTPTAAGRSSGRRRRGACRTGTRP